MLEELNKKIEKSIEILHKASQFQTLLIGLSGGKDSLALCELVKMAGITDVRYFFMYFLPDLRIEKELLLYPCERFNIGYDDIIQVPSEYFINSFQYNIFSFLADKPIKEKKVSRNDIFKQVIQLAGGMGQIVTGVKKADGLQMTRLVNSNNGIGSYPIKGWSTADVLEFLEIRKVGLPKLTLKGCRGVGLSDSSLMFIDEYYPDDLEKIEKVFPFCRSAILRYRYHDINKVFRVV